jgi:alpha-mannosidase
MLNNIINVDSDGAEMSGLFPTDDGEAVIARFYNPNSEPTSVKLSGIFTKAVQCDAFGKPHDNVDAHEFEMPTGMVTVRLS